MGNAEYMGQIKNIKLHIVTDIKIQSGRHSMVLNMDDLDSIRECCEDREIQEGHTGELSPDVYKQLLAIYLIDNDVINAKFLWKRIPEETKASNPELANIWHIGQSLWKRDFENVYVKASAVEWSSVTKPLIDHLCASLRTRMTTLIANAYSVIAVPDVSKLLGFSVDEAMEFARSQTWVVDDENQLIKPKKVNTYNNNVVSNGKSVETFDQLMNSLTDYVTFLEN